MSTSQFSSINEDTVGNLTLRTEVSGSPGNITLRSEATGSVGILPTSTDFDGDEDVVIIMAFVSGIQDFRQRVSDQISGLETLAGTIPNRFPTRIRPQIPDVIKNPGSARGYVTPTIGGQTLGPDEDNAVLEISADFTPIPIPTFDTLEGAGDRLPSDVANFSPADLPDLEFTVEARTLQSFGSLFAEPARTKVTLTGRAFVQEVSAGTLNCSELFSDLQSSITDLSGRMSRKERQANRALTELRGLSNRLSNAAGGGMAITDLSFSDVISLGRDELQNIRTDAERVNLSDINADQLRSEAEDLRRRANDIEFPCPDTDFVTDAVQLVDDAASIQDTVEQARTVRENITDLLSNIEVRPCGEVYPNVASRVEDLESQSIPDELSQSRFNTITSQIDSVEDTITDQIPRDDSCREQFLSTVQDRRSRVEGIFEGAEAGRVTQIRQELLNAVAGFQQDARDFLDKDRLQRRPERREALISEGERIRGRIRNSGDLTGGQKDRLLSRINEPLSRVRGAGVRTPEALPCGARFSGVDDEIDDFRDRVTDLTAPINPQELERVIRRGESVVNSIESQVPADTGCREEFTAEVRALINRAESLSGRVRVDTQTEEEARDRSDELINELLGQLERIEGTPSV